MTYRQRTLFCEWFIFHFVIVSW